MVRPFTWERFREEEGEGRGGEGGREVGEGRKISKMKIKRTRKNIPGSRKAEGGPGP
jgi:hypothetical protein